MKKILIIQGHHNKTSYCRALGDSYKLGAEKNGSEVRELILSEMNFDPILKYESNENYPELEPDLKKAQEFVTWAEHIVVIYPHWWGTIPALLKGFFERTFTSKFAFSYRKNSSLWDKHLTGKTARIIITMDTPKFFYYLFYQSAGHKVLKNNILDFCGIKTIGVTIFTPIRKSSDELRKKWLNEVNLIGLKDSKY